MNSYKIALAGNPNSGKTTLFNTLTGANARVGNWAGVTVEKKVGSFKALHDEFEIIDLPGTYSLSAYTLEEKIARDYIVEERPDVVINVVDASFLERSLFLLLEILETGQNTVLAVNMIDELEKRGETINLDEISSMLGIPVVPISALKKRGIKELLKTAVDTVGRPKERSRDGFIFSGSSDNDSHEKYAFIDKIMERATQKASLGFDYRSSRIDKVILNRYLAIPILVLIIYGMFFLTYNIGGVFSGILDEFFGGTLSDGVRALLESMSVAPLMVSLVVDGVIGGVGGILTFVPNIAVLFLIITLLEDSGYMARAALVTDKYMSKIGLNGRYLIPMILGFGCNVPAIMSTKTLENENDRMIAILTNPFISCSARFPVYVLFASVFFKGYETPITFSLYLLGVVIAIIVAYVFRRTLFKGEKLPFIMELPPYRLPGAYNVMIHVWEKVRGYLVKAGTVIFAASVMIWLLLNVGPSGFGDMTSSFGAIIGNAVAPVFAANGFGNWQSALSLLAGVSGKEIVVSNMMIVYGVGADASGGALTGILSGAFTAASAYAFMVFVLLYTPCVGVIGAIKRETNSWKWTVFSIVYQLVIAWVVSALVYQVLRLFIA